MVCVQCVCVWCVCVCVMCVLCVQCVCVSVWYVCAVCVCAACVCVVCVCVCCVCVCVLCVHLLEMLTTPEPSKTFCFILESCNHQTGKIERYVCGFARFIVQLIKFRSVHFHPAPFIRPSFYIFSSNEWPFRSKYEHSSFIIQYWYVLWCIYNIAVLLV